MADALAAIATLIAEQGLGTALIIGAIVFFYYKVWPQWIQNQDAQRKLTEEYRQNTLQEIKELKEDARQDKRLMYDAFLKNVESNVRLSESMDDFTRQLLELKTDMASLKNDVRNVYIIVGKDKKLINPSDIEVQR